MLAQAGLISGRHCGDVERARGWFTRLATIAPAHPSLHACDAIADTPVSARRGSRRERLPG
jgi:hypothetical protein